MRKPTDKELNILNKLTTKHNLNILLVENLDDGKMGSLAIGKNHANRKFGEVISDYHFTDLDGVDVIASLYIDTDGNLFELDIFKTNFNPTVILNREEK